MSTNIDMTRALLRTMRTELSVLITRANQIAILSEDMTPMHAALLRDTLARALLFVQLTQARIDPDGAADAQIPPSTTLDDFGTEEE